MRIALKGMCFLQDIFNFENTCSFELVAIKATRNVSINSETFGYRVLGFWGGQVWFVSLIVFWWDLFPTFDLCDGSFE